MYYRVNVVKYNPSDREAVLDFMESMRGEMSQIDGLKSVTIIETAPGQAHGFAGYESVEHAEAAVPIVQKIMGGMAQWMIAPPEMNMGHMMWSL